MNRLREGHKFYFNYITMEYAFDRPSNIKKDHSLLSKEEIQVRTIWDHFLEELCTNSMMCFAVFGIFTFHHSNILLVILMRFLTSEFHKHNMW